MIHNEIMDKITWIERFDTSDIDPFQSFDNV